MMRNCNEEGASREWYQDVLGSQPPPRMGHLWQCWYHALEALTFFVSYTPLFITYLWCRSALSGRIQCASMCTANANCAAYYFEVSECHQADGTGLIGANTASSTAMTVFIDSTLCMWNTWGSWSSCSKTCGSGTKTRTRTRFHGGSDCPGSPSKSKSCNTDTCPGGKCSM